MIIDFRYHVASLVAVFVALGLGIFIGSTLVGEDFMENIAKEQKIWIGKLESDYLTLKEETNKLHEDLSIKQAKISNYEKFASEIKPYVIAGKLKNKKIAIIKLGENNYYNDLLATLQQADAEIVCTVDFMSAELNETIESLSFSEQINNLLIKGEKGSFIRGLEKKNYLNIQGDYEENFDGIILINNSDNSSSVVDHFLIPIINNLQNELPIYVVETTNTINSAINKIKKFPNVCSVDNLDTTPGQIALVLSMQGLKGHFGVKFNTENILPSFLNKELKDEQKN